MTLLGSMRINFELNATQASREARRAQNAMDGLTKSVKRSGQSLVTAGRGLLPLTAAIVGLGVGVAKASLNFESGLAGVAKTTDFTKQGLQEFGKQIRELSTEIPVGTTELLKIAEAAGQLGVKEADILKFTETMAALGATTNLSATEAATALARFNNIFGESNDNVDRLGSVIVDLGNNFATTEKEIVTLGSRLAGAAKTIGLTQTETLGLATALSSVGILAEAGGSAFSRTMLRMQSAMEEGGKKARVFADVAGMSFEAFAATFRDTPMKAIQAFIEGLERVRQEGGNTTAILKDLNLDGIRVSDALRRASLAGDLLSDAVSTANTAFKENSALQTEVQRRYETTASQLIIFKNKIIDLAVSLGDSLLPILIDMVAALEPIVALLKVAAEGFGKLPKPVQTFVFALLAVTAAVGPMILAFGFLKLALTSLVGSLGAIGIAMGVAVAAITIGVSLWEKFAGSNKEAQAAVDALTESLSGQGSALNDSTRELVKGLPGYKDAEQNFRALSISVDEMIVAARGGSGAFQGILDTLSSTQFAFGKNKIDALTNAAAGFKGPAGEMVQELVKMQAAGVITVSELEQMLRVLAGLSDSFRGSADDMRGFIQKSVDAKAAAGGLEAGLGLWLARQLSLATSTEDLNRLVGDVESGMFDATRQAGDYASGMDGVRVAQEEANEALSDAGVSLDDAALAVEALGATMADMTSVSTLTSAALEIAEERSRRFGEAAALAAGESVDSWQEFAPAVTASIADYNAAMDDAIQATLDMKTNIATIMNALPEELRAGALAQLRTMVPGQIAIMADGSITELNEFAVNATTIMNTTADDLFDAWEPLPGDAAAIAARIVDGVILGLSNGQGRVWVAGLALGTVAVKSIASGSVVQSPSKATIKIGGFIAEGLAIGLHDGSAAVELAGRFLAEAGLAGIIDGFADIDSAVEALNTRMEDIRFEQATIALEDQRRALANLNDEYDQALLSQVSAIMAVEDAENAAEEATSDLARAQTDLGLARQQAALVTDQERAKILESNVALREAETDVKRLTIELGFLSVEIHNSGEMSRDSNKAILESRAAYNDAEDAVSALRLELDLLTLTGRSASDQTLDSALSIAAARVAIDKQIEKITKLEGALGKAEKGTFVFQAIQHELTLETLKNEKASQDLSAAVRTQTTVGEKQVELSDKLKIAEIGVSEALEAQTLATGLAITKGEAWQKKEDELRLAQDAVADAVLAVNLAKAAAVGDTEAVIAAEERLEVAINAEKDALQNVIDKQEESKKADDLVIAKKKEIEGSELSLELATLQFAKKWLGHMQQVGSDAETAAGRVNRALGSVPAKVVTTVEVNTEKATAKLSKWQRVLGAQVGATVDRIINSAENPQSDAFNKTFNDAIAAAKAKFPVVHPAPRVPTGGGGGGQQFAHGGLVPGSGPVPIVAHGGEVVIPASVVRDVASGGTVGGDTIVVNLYGTEATPEQTVQALRDWERRRGKIPISVKG